MNPMAFFASMNNHMASGAAGSAFNNGPSSDQKPGTNFVPVPVPFPVNHQNAASTNPPGNNFSPQGSGNSQFMGTGNMTSPPQQQSNWMNQQLQRTMTMNPHQVQQLLATIDTESLQAALLARAMLDQQRRMGVPASAPYMQQQQRTRFDRCELGSCHARTTKLQQSGFRQLRHEQESAVVSSTMTNRC